SVTASDGTSVKVTVENISGHGELRIGTRASATIEDGAGNPFTTAPFTRGFPYLRLSASTPVGWGDNSEGQLGNGTYDSPNVPTAAFTTDALEGKTVIAVSMGERHSVALSADGKVFTWGSNRSGWGDYGLLGIGE